MKFVDYLADELKNFKLSVIFPDDEYKIIDKLDEILNDKDSIIGDIKAYLDDRRYKLAEYIIENPLKSAWLQDEINFQKIENEFICFYYEDEE